MAVYVYKQDKKQYNNFKSEIQLDNKILTTPFYGSIVRSDIDTECLRDTTESGQLKNTQVVCYHLGDADRFRGMLQRGLHEFAGLTLNYRPFSEFVLTVDPAGEYLQYHVSSEVDKLLSIPDLPTEIAEIIRSRGEDKKRLLSRWMENESSVAGTVEWYLRKAIGYGSKTAVAPCLPIKGANTLRFACNINRLAVTTQEANEWQRAVYYLIDFASLKESDCLDTIKKQWYTLKPNIIILKFGNIEYIYKDQSFVERMNLTNLMDELYKYRITNNALTFVINADAIGYHYVSRGLCGFVEPISGNFNPDLRVRRATVDLEEGEEIGAKLGRYPDPLRHVEFSHENLRAIESNTGQAFPCHCFECSRYQRLPSESRIYNRARRRHRVHIRDNFIDEFNNAVLQSNLRVSMFDRFSESMRLNIFKGFYS
ncbi:hypothetical protein HYX03_04175 [Candidatus Woesearchaeota archaeon]|nr:hypothetical protein [Candidatus Woesearchaeota archaeon]